MIRKNRVFRYRTLYLNYPIDHVEMKKVPIIYGYPDDKLLKSAENNEVILGGCIIRKNQPKTGYICPACKRKFEN